MLECFLFLDSLSLSCSSCSCSEYGCGCVLCFVYLTENDVRVDIYLFVYRSTYIYTAVFRSIMAKQPGGDGGAVNSASNCGQSYYYFYEDDNDDSNSNKNTSSNIYPRSVYVSQAAAHIKRVYFLFPSFSLCCLFVNEYLRDLELRFRVWQNNTNPPPSQLVSVFRCSPARCRSSQYRSQCSQS